jgi:hypothetical protein
MFYLAAYAYLSLPTTNIIVSILALLLLLAATACHPQGYPSSEAALPLIDIDGPLGKHDPARTALQAHLAAAAAEQQQEMAGAGGYAWQLAGVVKEWIDANLPADIGSRRAGEVASTAAAGVQELAQGMEGLGINGVVDISNRNSGVAGRDSSSSSSSSSLPWWEKEDVDLTLIDRANAEAAAAHWRSWAVADVDSPFGAAAADDDQNGETHSSPPPAAAAAAGGVGFGGLESSRGRWDYTVGLVGKPSAGKSTFYNAVVGEQRAFNDP